MKPNDQQDIIFTARMVVLQKTKTKTMTITRTTKMAKKNKQNTSYLPPEGWCCRTLAELWPLRRWWRKEVANNPKVSKNLVSQHFPTKLCVHILSHLYPAHCIPSALSPSNLIIALASIWLYWNLVEIIAIFFSNQDSLGNHQYLQPASSECLTPIQTGLSVGKTRCSSSTRR